MTQVADMTFSSANPTFADDIRRRFATSPVCGFYGFELDHIVAGEITVGLSLRDELGHAPGWFQGTVVGAVADYAGSYAAYTLIPDAWSRLTLDYTLKFLGPARGDRLIGRGRVLSHGWTLSTCAADVFVREEGQERLAATALVSVRHTPPRD